MLLDTAGLLCLFDADEPFHALAHTRYAASPTRLTHGYVIAEFLPLTHARRLPRGRALAFLTDLLTADDIEIVWVDRDLNRRAMDLLLDRMDKTYSLCD